MFDRSFCFTFVHWKRKPKKRNGPVLVPSAQNDSIFRHSPQKGVSVRTYRPSRSRRILPCSSASSASRRWFYRSHLLQEARHEWTHSVKLGYRGARVSVNVRCANCWARTQVLTENSEGDEFARQVTPIISSPSTRSRLGRPHLPVPSMSSTRNPF